MAQPLWGFVSYKTDTRRWTLRIAGGKQSCKLMNAYSDSEAQQYIQIINGMSDEVATEKNVDFGNSKDTS